jgi:hypothetical protein
LAYQYGIQYAAALNRGMSLGVVSYLRSNELTGNERGGGLMSWRQPSVSVGRRFMELLGQILHPAHSPHIRFDPRPSLMPTRLVVTQTDARLFVMSHAQFRDAIKGERPADGQGADGYG